MNSTVVSQYTNQSNFITLARLVFVLLKLKKVTDY